MLTKWSSILNPLLKKVLPQGLLLSNVALANGDTTINHLLSRQMIGWFLTDIDGAAQIYRSQPLNDKTLTLTSSAAVTVSIWVF